MITTRLEFGCYLNEKQTCFLVLNMIFKAKSVQEACIKCLVVHTLKFEIQMKNETKKL